MKLVILVEGDTDYFEDISDSVEDPFVVITNHCNDEINEYRYLENSIELFSTSISKEIMLAHFSGKNNIVKNLGEDRPEMIITLSNKESSNYYSECPKQDIFNLIYNMKQGELYGITA